MTQAVMALLGAALTIAACYAAGVLLFDRLQVPVYRAERTPLAFVTGAACLHLAVFAILALKIAYWPVLGALLAAVIAVAVWQGSWKPRGKDLPPLGARLRIFAGILFGAFTILYFFHAWAPESSPDGAGYHLGLVARYLRAHGFERITNNILASFSEGVEMLFVPAFAIGRHSAGALVHFTFAIALAMAMVAYGRRIGQPWAGVAGAFLTFASPVAGIDGSSAYNDVAVAAVVFAVFHFLEVWDDNRDARLLIPVGLLAGYAYAVKYTAFVILPFALVWVFWRTRRWKEPALVIACSLMMVAPWMIKNWIYVDNPVAPFANTIFRNPYVHVQFERDLAQKVRRYDVANKWTLPLEVTVRGGNTSGVIGPAFLAAPLALLALWQRAGRRLLAAGALMLAVYFFNIGTRFLIPVLPFFSLAIALAVSYSPALLIIVMLFHAATAWPAGMRVYALPYTWGLDHILFRQALRIVPPDTYLRRTSDAYSYARMIEANVPPGAAVFASAEPAAAYTTRDVRIRWASAANQTLDDIFNTGWEPDWQPTFLHTFRFAERSLRRVRLTVTAPGKPGQPWGVHEIRLYDHGVELPRRPEWRLSAWPNPWDVQMAFDNSPATRWRTWEPAAAGMYLQVDFETPQVIDEVRVWNSSDDGEIKTQLQGIDAEPEASTVPVPRGIRRAATHELYVRGIRYLFLGDSDYGSEDVRDDPESWGLKEIAVGFGCRLYKVVW